MSYQIGLTYYHLEKFNRAGKNVHKALEYYSDKEDVEGLQDCYLLLAMANDKMGNSVQP